MGQQLHVDSEALKGTNSRGLFCSGSRRQTHLQTAGQEHSPHHHPGGFCSPCSSENSVRGPVTGDVMEARASRSSRASHGTQLLGSQDKPAHLPVGTGAHKE